MGAVRGVVMGVVSEWYLRRRPIGGLQVVLQPLLACALLVRVRVRVRVRVGVSLRARSCAASSFSAGTFRTNLLLTTHLCCVVHLGVGDAARSHSLIDEIGVLLTLC